MLAIIGCLFGIFVGIATAGYMFIQPLADRDRTIKEQKEENLQVCDENKELRAENEDIKFELSVANKEIERKDEIVQKIAYEISRNEYNNNEALRVKLSKINELVKIYQNIN